MSYFSQTSDRLNFRKLTPADIPNWLVFFDDNPGIHFLGMDLTKTPLELATGWITAQFDRYENQGLGHLAIELKETGEFIGMAGIIPRDLNEINYYEIAYSFKPRFWGNGYASEAAQQLKKFGRESGLSEHYISIIDLDNFPSQKVARKNNMEILFKTDYLGMEVLIFGTSK
jgi:ribosomal-protein-alanine N-acetyltransferase